MPTTEVEIKGHAFRTTLLVIRELFGSDIERRLSQGLSDPFRSTLLTNSLLESGWYPASWYRQYYDGLHRLMPHEADVARRIGRTTTGRDLGGIYQFILRLSSPELLARHFDKILRSYFRGGEVSVDVQPGRFVLNTLDWHGMNQPMLEEAIAGCEVLIERTGVRIVETEVREIAAGAYRVELRWE